MHKLHAPCSNAFCYAMEHKSNKLGFSLGSVGRPLSLLSLVRSLGITTLGSLFEGSVEMLQNLSRFLQPSAALELTSYDGVN